MKKKINIIPLFPRSPKLGELRAKRKRESPPPDVRPGNAFAKLDPP